MLGADATGFVRLVDVRWGGRHERFHLGNEQAGKFAYRAQALQRHMLRRQRRYGAAIGSRCLDVMAGYGYRPGQAVSISLLLIAVFAVAYYGIGLAVGPQLPPVGALVFSVTSFHGRGFFPGGSPSGSDTLNDPLTMLAAAEAVVGLVIEISFLATFTQRFFAR